MSNRLKIKKSGRGFHSKMIKGELCLPVKEIPGWLLSIDVSEIPDIEKRELLIEYQKRSIEVIEEFNRTGIVTSTEEDKLLYQKVLEMIGMI